MADHRGPSGMFQSTGTRSRCRYQKAPDFPPLALQLGTSHGQLPHPECNIQTETMNQ